MKRAAPVEAARRAQALRVRRFALVDPGARLEPDDCDC